MGITLKVLKWFVLTKTKNNPMLARQGVYGSLSASADRTRVIFTGLHLSLQKLDHYCLGQVTGRALFPQGWCVVEGLHVILWILFILVTSPQNANASVPAIQIHTGCCALQYITSALSIYSLHDMLIDSLINCIYDII